MHVHPHQQLSVDYSRFAFELVHELELKSQTFVDMFLPSSNKCGSNSSDNCFYCGGIIQLGPPSRAKLLSEGAVTEILNVFVINCMK